MDRAQSLNLFMLCTVMANFRSSETPGAAATLASGMHENRAKPRADWPARIGTLKRTKRSTGLAAVGMLVNVSMKPIDKDAMI